MMLKKDHIMLLHVGMDSRNEKLRDFLNEAIEMENQFNEKSRDFRQYVKKDDGFVFLENSFIADVCNIRMRIQGAIELNEKQKEYYQNKWGVKAHEL